MFLPPDNISRTSTAVFIPLTILALQLTIVDKVPIVGYYTLMDKFFLACFILSMIVSMESGLIYSLLVSNPKKIYSLIAKYWNIREELDDTSIQSDNKSIDSNKSLDSIEMVSNHLKSIANSNLSRRVSYSDAMHQKLNSQINLDIESVNNDIIKDNIVKTIDYNDKSLYMTPLQNKVNDIFNRKVIIIDNIIRISLPIIYTIYISVLLS